MTRKMQRSRVRSNSRRSFLKGLGAAAAGFSFAGPAFAGANKEDPVLNFHNWDTYIGETTIDDFRIATGIEVRPTIFNTNDELLAAIQKPGHGLDVIVPGSEYVERMIAQNLLRPLDHSKLRKLKNITPDFADPAFDRGLKYSVPYTWLVIGIGYRYSKVKSPPDSWQALFDSDLHAGRIAVMGNAMELYRIAFQYLGGTVNSADPGLIERVQHMLEKQLPRIKEMHKDDGQDLLLSGQCDLVMEYNGDIAQVMAEDDDIGFVVPKEGSLKQCDTLCIPTAAPHPDNAHKFINYILDGEAGAAISRTILYPTPNAAAARLMPEEFRSNPAIFPPSDILAKCDYPRYLGPEITGRIQASFASLQRT